MVAIAGIAGMCHQILFSAFQLQKIMESREREILTWRTGSESIMYGLPRRRP